MKTNEKLGEILQLCLQLQASGWGDVFYSTSGHVSKVTIIGFKGGQKSEVEPTFYLNSFYDGPLKDYEDDWMTPVETMFNKLKSYMP